MDSSFLNKITLELLEQSSSLKNYTLIFPGKRPTVFFKKHLAENGYTGFLPEFFTIEELMEEIAGVPMVQGLSLWLFAYDVYSTLYTEDFNQFLKWFPTALKDWDDILKYKASEKEVFSYMHEEERIKNWGDSLGDPTETQKKNLNFWRRLAHFFPILKQKLIEKGWYSYGMVYEKASENLETFIANVDQRYVFCGFNAITPIEKDLMRGLLQWNKAQCFFDADQYYLNDKRQEAGKFLRSTFQWKEFGDHRKFNWIENEFIQPKDIEIIEVSGNVSQTKVLPSLLENLSPLEISQTAVVLLDENLLPATLESLQFAESLNITMGFPIKNLDFSLAIKKIFHLHKQLAKSKSYYYRDVNAIINAIESTDEDKTITHEFQEQLRSKNLVYLSQKRLQELLGNLSYLKILQPYNSPKALLKELIEFCLSLKSTTQNDLLYENITLFENAFKIAANQLEGYQFEVSMETLELMMNHLIGSEEIKFQGEPLEGLQVMGLLETRLLSFENIILLSTNEGNLPQGSSHNSYLPFDVRLTRGLPTYLENDSIYAYHFYRLLQKAKKATFLYNSLSSGVNTGEKSRFLTQIELESKHSIKHTVVDADSLPVQKSLMTIEKTPSVLERLEEWKSKVAATHLTSYMYNPIQFYLKSILKLSEEDDIEEEISRKSYGTLVHYALQVLYEPLKGKLLYEKDLNSLFSKIDEAIQEAITKLDHPLEAYEKGMNFVHKTIARDAVESVIKYDLALVNEGSKLEILALEHPFSNLAFDLENENGDQVFFKGFIDRIDRLDGVIRVTDYKSGKLENLELKFKDQSEDYLIQKSLKQAIQLSIYLWFLKSSGEFKGVETKAHIWSFINAKKGPQPLTFVDGDLNTAMNSIRTLIQEILNPEIPFEQKEIPVYTKSY